VTRTDGKTCKKEYAVNYTLFLMSIWTTEKQNRPMPDKRVDYIKKNISKES